MIQITSESNKADVLSSISSTNWPASDKGTRGTDPTNDLSLAFSTLAGALTGLAIPIKNKTCHQ